MHIYINTYIHTYIDIPSHQTNERSHKSLNIKIIVTHQHDCHRKNSRYFRILREFELCLHFFIELSSKQSEKYRTTKNTLFAGFTCDV